MRKIAVLGAGNMGEAIARSIPKDIELRLTAATRATLDRLAPDFADARLLLSNQEAVEEADMQILAVKPWIAPDVIKEIAPMLKSGSSLVSVVAGISTQQLTELLGRDDINIIRAVPNTAIRLGKSVTFLTPAAGCSDQALKDAEQLFALSGKTWIIPEKDIDVCTALASCGIAFFLRFIRAAAEGAVQLGLKPGFATIVAAATAEGAAALLADGSHPEVEIDKVTTPGGITIRGLNALEQYGLNNAVIQALKASV